MWVFQSICLLTSAHPTATAQPLRLSGWSFSLHSLMQMEDFRRFMCFTFLSLSSICIPWLQIHKVSSPVRVSVLAWCYKSVYTGLLPRPNKLMFLVVYCKFRGLSCRFYNREHNFNLIKLKMILLFLLVISWWSMSAARALQTCFHRRYMKTLGGISRPEPVGQNRTWKFNLRAGIIWCWGYLAGTFLTVGNQRCNFQASLLLAPAEGWAGL